MGDHRITIRHHPPSSAINEYPESQFRRSLVLVNTYGLDSDGTFTGSFSGGFYESKAAEAGGVFDFTSEAAEDGAFRGAFGADRDPE